MNKQAKFNDNVACESQSMTPDRNFQQPKDSAMLIGQMFVIFPYQPHRIGILVYFYCAR